MNTADRSIALVDAAMRRRFAFEQVHPSECPVRGLLDRWLHEHGHRDETARLLDQLNTRIEDPDFAIGPSHFHAPGRAPPGRRAAAASDRQADAWSRPGKVHPVRRPLRYPPSWPTEPAQQKRVDVALAVDLVRLAIQDAYDVGIVVSADTDLLPRCAGGARAASGTHRSRRVARPTAARAHAAATTRVVPPDQRARRVAPDGRDALVACQEVQGVRICHGWARRRAAVGRP